MTQIRYLCRETGPSWLEFFKEEPAVHGGHGERINNVLGVISDQKFVLFQM